MKTGHAAGPGRWVRALLERFLPEDQREFVLGDLLEDFARRRSRNPRQARRHFRRQALGTLLTLAFGPRRDKRTRTKGETLMRTWIQDFRYGARKLLAAPGFTLIAVATLGLGIGANSAVFSLVHGIVLRALPYPEADRLVLVYNRWNRFPRGSISAPEFLEIQTRQRSFQGMALFNTRDVNFTVGAGDPERLRIANVTSGFLSVLGVQPVLGTIWSSEDDYDGGRRMLLISHRLWSRRFASDPSIVGKFIRLHEEEYQVAGVLPAGFGYPAGSVDLWRPVRWTSNALQSWGGHNYGLIARLAPEVGLASAQAELEGVAEILRREHSGNYPEGSGFGTFAIPLQETIVGGFRESLLILLAAAGGVLLIACANIANLQLARGASRLKEMGIRSALGAGRGRLIRMLLSENLLLGAIGAAAGFIAASWVLDALTAWNPGDIPRLNEVEVSGAVVLFTLLISQVAALASGAAPALLSARLDLQSVLRQGGRSARLAVRGSLRGTLVAAEVALATVVLISAGLLVRSFDNLLAVEPGFEARQVATAQINLNPGRYREPQHVVAFLGELLSELGAQPGVRSAGAINVLPLSGHMTDIYFAVEGYQAPSGETPDAQRRQVAGDFFQSLEIPLLEGRFFDSRDNDSGAPSAIVNAALARHYWGGASAIGGRLKLGGIDSSRPWRTVVGVVGDVHDEDLAIPPEPTLYLPHAQDAERNMTLALRVDGDPFSFQTLLSDVVHRMDPQLPVFGAGPLEQVRSDSVSRPRFVLLLLSAFALMALLLAAVGIYGLLSYTVSQRRHDIGVGLALGARRRDIYRLVLFQDLARTLAGAAIGVLAALFVTKFMETLLFGVEPTDPFTLGAAVVVLLSVAIASTLVPARRATRVDPIDAMRAE